MEELNLMIDALVSLAGVTRLDIRLDIGRHLGPIKLVTDILRSCHGLGAQGYNHRGSLLLQFHTYW